LKVLKGTIAFVSTEPILGKVLVVAIHDSIPRDLGNDRGGGNGRVEAISMRESPMRERGGRRNRTVNQQELRGLEKVSDGFRHGQEGSLEDASRIDGPDIHDPPAHGNRLLLDRQAETFPSPRMEELRVVQPLDMKARREDHRSSDYGSC